MILIHLGMLTIWLVLAAAILADGKPVKAGLFAAVCCLLAVDALISLLGDLAELAS